VFEVDPTIILGGPGTGKTTRLIAIVEQEIKDGAIPERIAYVSFTRQAAYGARKRIDLTEKQTPWFRTLHSMAFRRLGMSRTEVMDNTHYQKVCEMLGMTYTGFVDLESPAHGPEGNKCLGIVEYSRNTLQDLKEAWSKHGSSIDWFKLKRFYDTLLTYKKDMQLIDYSDMLERFVSSEATLDIDVAIIDEAQDLTPLQWKVASIAFKTAKRVYVGGDDDQAIYKWSGADVDTFINLKGKVEVLEKSYRQPKEVFKQSSLILNRIKVRRNKIYQPSDREGQVFWHNRVEGIDLSKGSWLLIARNYYLLRHYEMLVREQGYLYSTKGKLSFEKTLIRAIQAYEKLRKNKSIAGSDINLVFKKLKIKKKVDASRTYNSKMLGLDTSRIWHDAFKGVNLKDREYLVACLRRGEDPRIEPRIRIDTIHASKGAEADNVIVMSDVSRQSYMGMQLTPDDEHRVFYVALTRAIKNLHLVQPQTSMSYRL